MKDYTLDEEEQVLLQSIESGEWESVENLDTEIKLSQEIARHTLKKDKRINIRLSAYDINALKTNAVELGLPYQTLVSSVLHQYATGRLIQR